MKKMPTLFVRNFLDNHTISITREVTPGCEWVINGEGVATRKFDGTCTMFSDGKLYKRYDAKKGKQIPEGAILCQPEADTATGHLPCWLPVDFNKPENKWFAVAVKNQGVLPDGTYELCGKHFQNNPERIDGDIDVFIKHGSVILQDVPRDFDGIFEYLSSHYIEGIVFHRGNGDMCKIKRTDFGLEWNGSVRKIK